MNVRSAAFAEPALARLALADQSDAAIDLRARPRVCGQDGEGWFLVSHGLSCEATDELVNGLLVVCTFHRTSCWNAGRYASEAR